MSQNECAFFGLRIHFAFCVFILSSVVKIRGFNECWRGRLLLVLFTGVFPFLAPHGWVVVGPFGEAFYGPFYRCGFSGQRGCGAARFRVPFAALGAPVNRPKVRLSHAPRTDRSVSGGPPIAYTTRAWACFGLALSESFSVPLSACTRCLMRIILCERGFLLRAEERRKQFCFLSMVWTGSSVPLARLLPSPDQMHQDTGVRRDERMSVPAIAGAGMCGTPSGLTVNRVRCESCERLVLFCACATMASTFFFDT